MTGSRLLYQSRRELMDRAVGVGTPCNERLARISLQLKLLRPNEFNTLSPKTAAEDVPLPGFGLDHVMMKSNPPSGTRLVLRYTCRITGESRSPTLEGAQAVPILYEQRVRRCTLLKFLYPTGERLGGG